MKIKKGFIWTTGIIAAIGIGIALYAYYTDNPDLGHIVAAIALIIGFLGVCVAFVGKGKSINVVGDGNNAVVDSEDVTIDVGQSAIGEAERNRIKELTQKLESSALTEPERAELRQTIAALQDGDGTNIIGDNNTIVDGSSRVTIIKR